MHFLSAVADVFLHLDEHLGAIISQFGTLTYGLLFLVVFCETGLVVTPFLPGDSLLFAVGAFGAIGSLQPLIGAGVLFAAAVLGDAANYGLGRRAGSSMSRYVKPAQLAQTTDFYAKHGAKTIVLARFVPIVRTLAPFVAGLGAMPYRTFAAYNLLGGALWVGLLTGAGYLFGNIPWVRANFEIVVLAIIAVSLLPALLHLLPGTKPSPHGTVVPEADDAHYHPDRQSES